MYVCMYVLYVCVNDTLRGYDVLCWIQKQFRLLCFQVLNLQCEQKLEDSNTKGLKNKSIMKKEITIFEKNDEPTTPFFS